MSSTVPANALAGWTTRLLEGWGYAPDDAAFLADTLVEANLRGIDSHGVIRLPAYHRRIEEGLVRTDAQPAVTVDRALVSVDAAGAAGQLAARAAMDALTETARAHGVASATVHGSAHFGTAGYYARELAARGFVAFVLSNSEPIVVPFGGRDALLGTNPFAFAAPAEPFPISLDMATSTSAMGKVFVAQSEGKAIPADWGVDAEGAPTTDPHAVSALLPFGGPKGYGMGYLVEIMAGVLSGAAVSHGIGNMYNDFSKPQDVGHWMLAIDVAALMPLADFVGRMGSLGEAAHGTAPAPGSSGVLVPGEPEERTRAARLDGGVPLPETVVGDLVALGERFDAAFPGGAA